VALSHQVDVVRHTIYGHGLHPYIFIVEWEMIDSTFYLVCALAIVLGLALLNELYDELVGK
jgi:hypothetical protein